MAAPDHKSRLHVVMFPWLAFGHLIPYLLDLAKILSASFGHRISFVTTPRNAARLPHVPPSIAIVSIPLPAVPGLPDGAEATTDISGDTQMDLLKKAFDGLEPGLTRFLSDSDPDWIITDFGPHWLPPITARLGICTAFVFIMNACFLSFFGSVEHQLGGLDYRTRPEDYMVPPRWVGFETLVAYRRYEANVILRLGKVGESGISDLHRTSKVVMGADAIDQLEGIPPIKMPVARFFPQIQAATAICQALQVCIAPGIISSSF